MGRIRHVLIDGSNDEDGNGSKHKFGKNYHSSYRDKLKRRLSQLQKIEEIEEVNMEPVIVSANPYVRTVEYIIVPGMDTSFPTRFRDNFIILNYIFLNGAGQGYRTAFIPRNIYLPDVAEEIFFSQPHCRKLTERIVVKSKHQNLYLNDDGSIFLGDIFNPTQFNMTLVDKLKESEQDLLRNFLKSIDRF